MTCDAKSTATAIGGRLSPFVAAMARPMQNLPCKTDSKGLTTNRRRFRRAGMPAAPQKCRESEHFLRRCNQFGGQCSGAEERCQSWQSNVFSFSQSWLHPFPAAERYLGQKPARYTTKPHGGGRFAGCCDILSENEAIAFAIHNLISIYGLRHITHLQSANLNMLAIETCDIRW
jgi:hypothetical protein